MKYLKAIEGYVLAESVRDWEGPCNISTDKDIKQTIEDLKKIEDTAWKLTMLRIIKKLLKGTR
jgi:hypothetical protein